MPYKPVDFKDLNCGPNLIVQLAFRCITIKHLKGSPLFMDLKVLYLS